MASVKDILTSTLADNALDADEFLRLRRQIFQDGHISMEEANMVFKVDTESKELPEGWDDFFVGAITDFLIRQTLPVGYVDPIHATWLIERIEHDDRMSESTEMELILNVIRLAKDVPRNLELYALNKIRDKIISRSAAGDLTVTADDVVLLKRVLYASGGSGGFSICKEEARFLFDLDEICQSADNAPEWQKLFVGAVANHVMTMGAPKMASREDYKRAQEYLHSNQGIKWSISNIKTTFKEWLSNIASNEDNTPTSIFSNDALIREAEAIDAQEAAWLIEHLNRDGTISPNERELLKFFKDECPNIHESLKPLLRQAA